MSLSVSHLSSSGANANVFTWGGASGGNVLTVTYGPVPPSPPSPPPAATVGPVSSPSPTAVQSNFPLRPPATEWTVNTADYENDASLTASVTIGGIAVTTGEVAAVVGSSVRGVQAGAAGPPGTSGLLFSVTVKFNEAGETFNFLYYDGCATTVLAETRSFEINAIIGSAITPFALSAPSLAVCDQPATPNYPLRPDVATEWVVITADYENDATVTSIVTIGGVEMSSGEVAAVVDSSVRAVGTASSTPSGGTAFSLQIKFNEAGETFNFLYYDGCATTVLTESRTFTINENVGSLITPFELTAASLAECAGGSGSSSRAYPPP